MIYLYNNDPKLPNFLPFILGVIVMVIIAMLIAIGTARAESINWEWTKEENPNFVAYVERYKWSWFSWYAIVPTNYDLGDELQDNENLLYNNNRNIKIEILAYQKRIWPDGMVDAGEQWVNYLVKIKKTSGEIKNIWLPQTCFVTTRRKNGKNDIGGYLVGESILDKIFRNSGRD